MLKHKRRSVIKLAGSAAAVASTGMAGIWPAAAARPMPSRRRFIG